MRPAGGPPHAAGDPLPLAAPLRPPRRAFDFYRAFQKVVVDRANGEVALRFHRTDVLRVRPNGDVALTTGGYFTA